MDQSNLDPRIQRTRKLIMDSFIKISSEKEFKDITVKDITVEAMINRATFYYHFEDKYDLLDKALSEVLLVNLDSRIFEQSTLNDETIIKLFKSTTDFQESLPTRCQVGHEDTLSPIIREQLEVIIYNLLLKQLPNDDKQNLTVTSVILSWGIYGASVEWKRSKLVSPEEYIKPAIPYLISRINTNSKNQ